MPTVSTQFLRNLVGIVKITKSNFVTLQSESDNLFVSIDATFSVRAKTSALVADGKEFCVKTNKELLLPLLQRLEAETADTTLDVEYEGRSTLLRLCCGSSTLYIPCEISSLYTPLEEVQDSNYCKLPVSELQKTVATALKAAKKPDEFTSFIMLEVKNELTAIGVDRILLIAASAEIPSLYLPKNPFFVLLPLDLATAISKLPDIGEPFIELYHNEQTLTLRYGEFTFAAPQYGKPKDKIVPAIQEMLSIYHSFPIKVSASLKDFKPLAGVDEALDVEVTHTSMTAKGDTIQHSIPLTIDSWQQESQNLSILLNGTLLDNINKLFPKRGTVTLYFKESLSPIFCAGDKTPLKLVYCFMPMKRM